MFVNIFYDYPLGERDRRSEFVMRGERGCDWSSDTARVRYSQLSQLARLLPFTAPPLSPLPTVCVASQRAVVLIIICEVVNEKDVCICTSRLSVDFHRRRVANVSHGYL